jgi:predicted deacylase
MTAQLLVWSTRCVIDKENSFCDKLDSFGESISLEQRKWLAFLATRRDTIIVPAANCVGHKFRKRTEGSVDPNRDFGYSRRDNRCFLSSTAKIFNEIMKRNIIQIVVTFHGGMVALGYEWGSRNHPSPRDQSPDELSHKDIATLMKDVAGGFTNEKPYPGKLWITKLQCNRE